MLTFIAVSYTFVSNSHFLLLCGMRRECAVFQVLNGSAAKLTFAWRCLESCCSESVQHIVQGCQMLLPCLAVYNNVIQIHHDLVPQQVRNHIVHKPLECRRSRSETKRQDKELKKTIPGDRGCLVPVLRVQHNLPMASLQVKLTDHCALPSSFRVVHLICPGQRVRILLGDLI